MSTEDIQKEELKDQVEKENTETTEVEEQKEDVVELSVEEQLTVDLASEKGTIGKTTSLLTCLCLRILTKLSDIADFPVLLNSSFDQNPSGDISYAKTMQMRLALVAADLTCRLS